MNAESVLRTLRSEMDSLRNRYGIKSLGVFGSIVRGEDSPQSDVDVLVEFQTPSFDRYMDLKFHLEELLGRTVDLVLEESLKPALRDRILREVRSVA